MAAKEVSPRLAFKAHWVAAVLAWIAGFAAYNWINPGYVSWWTSFVKHTLGHLPHAPSWAGASLTSFAVSLVLTVVFGPLTRRHRTRSPALGT